MKNRGLDSAITYGLKRWCDSGGFIVQQSAMPCSEDTIYYIKTDTPHLSDCSFFGPFKSLEAAVPSIRKNLYQTSLPGLDTFDELMSASPNGLTSLQHFAAPLRDGGVMMIHIVKEQNAE